MQKEFLKTAWEKSKTFFLALSKVAIIAIAMGTGFAAGELYYRYTSSVKSREMQKPHTKDETSVAINERGEVLIVNRKTGTYEIYSDTVGRMVFDLYASKMYYETKK